MRNFGLKHVYIPYDIRTEDMEYLKGKSDKTSVNLSSVSVLVFDTDEFSRNFMRQICRSLKFNEVFSTGEHSEVSQILSDNAADLIICDWMITPSGAFDFIRDVRTSSVYPDPSIPIVVLSAINDAKTLLAARNSGISAWIARPIVLTRLVSCLEACLKAPRPFVKTTSYAGPCRRRKQREFQGEDRRGRGRQQAALTQNSADLSRRAASGGGLTVGEMIKAGETVIREEEVRYREIRKNDLNELFALIRALKDEPSTMDEKLGKIYRKVNDLKGWGETFGFPFLTKVGDLMSDFILSIPPNAAKELFYLQSVEIYATVMKMIIDSDMRDEDDELARELMSELQALTNKAATLAVQ